jgi:hypothetical protein
MGSVRQFVVGIAVLMAAVVALSPAMSAATAGSSRTGHPGALASTDLVVTGSFTGTGTLGPECGVFHVVVNGSGDWTGLGLSTFTLDFCLGSDEAIFDGTFTITAADGGTLTGDMSGSVEATGPGPEFPLHFVLTVTDGTGRYQGATGSIAMEGVFGARAETVNGTVDGVVTLAPSTPSSTHDCRNGGWQHVVDENGQPFRNQGHCISWVVHHT